jgi:hypothetical protein
VRLDRRIPDYAPLHPGYAAGPFPTRLVPFEFESGPFGVRSLSIVSKKCISVRFCTEPKEF